MGKSYRKIAREKATIGIYQNLCVGSTYEDILIFLNEEKKLTENPQSMEFSQWLIKTTLDNKESYQKLIEKYLKKGWTFDRLGQMEKAILLIATCELLESDIPNKIIVNEAVNNAKTFCDDQSYKFVNGILAQLCDE